MKDVEFFKALQLYRCTSRRQTARSLYRRRSLAAAACQLLSLGRTSIRKSRGTSVFAAARLSVQRRIDGSRSQFENRSENTGFFLFGGTRPAAGFTVTDAKDRRRRTRTRRLPSRVRRTAGCRRTSARGETRSQSRRSTWLGESVSGAHLLTLTKAAATAAARNDQGRPRTSRTNPAVSQRRN